MLGITSYHHNMHAAYHTFYDTSCTVATYLQHTAQDVQSRPWILTELRCLFLSVDEVRGIYGFSPRTSQFLLISTKTETERPNCVFCIKAFSVLATFEIVFNLSSEKNWLDSELEKKGKEKRIDAKS